MGLALLVSLSSSGPAAADLSTALAAYDRGDLASAFDEFRILADDGDTQAMLWTGYLYQEGQGTERNLGEAMRYFRMAADYGEGQVERQADVRYEER